MALLIIYCAITIFCEILISILVSLLFGENYTLNDFVMLHTASAPHKLLLFVLAIAFLKSYKSKFDIKDLLVTFGVFVALFWFYSINAENEEVFGQTMAVCIIGFLTCIFMVGHAEAASSNGARFSSPH